MQIHIALLCACLSLVSLPVGAAPPAAAAQRGPERASPPAVENRSRVCFLAAPPLPPPPASPAAQRRFQIGLSRALSSAIVINSNTAPARDWTTFSDGWRVLSAAVASEGALGLRVHLQDLALPPGSRLVLYDPANPRADPAPVTAERLAGRSEYWTSTLFASQAVVECQVPAGVDLSALSVTISGLSHIYTLPGGKSLKEGSCNLDATCYGDYAQEASGVARISFVSNGDTYLCSGCRIQASDSSDSSYYFLTANHCIGNQNEASSMELYWLFQTASCDGAAPVLSDTPTTSGGATLLATSTLSDFTFVRLIQAPPAGTSALSWSTTAPTASETLVCIHHPEGAYKRICFGHYIGGDEDFWGVRWYSGVTEPGSSGSPLLNARHQIIGQLNGGYEGAGSSCSAPYDPDQYGRFDVSFKFLGAWLGSSGSDTNSGGSDTNATGGVTYSPMKGTYYGLFADADNGLSVESAGSFKLSTTVKSRFSGQVAFCGARYAISGALDGAGTGAATIKRRNASTLQLVFAISPDDPDTLSGTLSSDSWSATLEANRATYNSRTNSPFQAGQYTVLVPGSSEDASIPSGQGYGRVTVDKSGSIRLAASLADGAGASQSSSLSRDGLWPLFVPLYSGKGFLCGWVSFTNAETLGLSGDISWSRPANTKAKAYKDGFSFSTSLGGSLYTRPGKGVPILNWSNACIALLGSTLSQPITNEIVLNSNNKVSNLSSNRLSLSFSTSTGLFSGSVRDPASRAAYSFHGAILQNEQIAAGYFLSSGQSGEVVLEPETTGADSASSD